MADFKLTKTTLKDIDFVVKHPRLADIEELKLFGSNMERALNAGYALRVLNGKCYTLKRKKTPLFIGGYYQTKRYFDLDGQVLDSKHLKTAIIWGLASTFCTESPITLVKTLKLVRNEAANKFDLIFNRIDPRNTLHINTLKRLGFYISPDFTYFNTGNKVKYFNYTG